MAILAEAFIDIKWSNNPMPCPEQSEGTYQEERLVNTLTGTVYSLVEV